MNDNESYKFHMVGTEPTVFGNTKQIDIWYTSARAYSVLLTREILDVLQTIVGFAIAAVTAYPLIYVLTKHQRTGSFLVLVLTFLLGIVWIIFDIIRDSFDISDGGVSSDSMGWIILISLIELIPFWSITASAVLSTLIVALMIVHPLINLTWDKELTRMVEQFEIDMLRGKGHD